MSACEAPGAHEAPTVRERTRASPLLEGSHKPIIINAKDPVSAAKGEGGKESVTGRKDRSNPSPAIHTLINQAVLLPLSASVSPSTRCGDYKDQGCFVSSKGFYGSDYGCPTCLSAPGKLPDRRNMGKKYFSLSLVLFKQSTHSDLRIVCIHHAANT